LGDLGVGFEAKAEGCLTHSDRIVA
jgi:hypothetical protein